MTMQTYDLPVMKRKYRYSVRWSLPLTLLMFGVVFSLTLQARDYSYMDDHPFSVSDPPVSGKRALPSLGSEVADGVVDDVVDTVVDSTLDRTIDHYFSPDEKTMIRRYFNEQQVEEQWRDRDDRYRYGRHDHDYDDHDYDKKKKHKKKSLPPGLQKKVARGGELPPGWQKKLQRGEVIDSNTWHASRPLPSILDTRLPHHQGVEIREIEGNVYKVIEATGIILDVFQL